MKEDEDTSTTCMLSPVTINVETSAWKDKNIKSASVSARWKPKITAKQGGITCGANNEPRKSSKAIDKRVITNFRDKNVVSARFGDKNEAFILLL